MNVWLGKVWNVMEAPWTPKGMIQLQKILKLYEASVEDILDDMEMFIFDWPSTLLWYSDFLRFDDWKNPLAKMTVLVPLGALLVSERRFPNLTNLDRFGPVSKCISAYYSNVLTLSDQNC